MFHSHSSSVFRFISFLLPKPLHLFSFSPILPLRCSVSSNGFSLSCILFVVESRHIGWRVFIPRAPSLPSWFPSQSSPSWVQQFPSYLSSSQLSSKLFWSLCPFVRVRTNLAIWVWFLPRLSSLNLRSHLSPPLFGHKNFFLPFQRRYIRWSVPCLLSVIVSNARICIWFVLPYSNFYLEKSML